MSNLDREDRIRELKLAIEMANMLTSSEPWAWFMDKLDDERALTAKRMVDKRLKFEDYIEEYGVGRGLALAAAIVGRQRNIALAELESLGVKAR